MAGNEWSVRSFAAIDMYGRAGTRRRRRIVTAEFVLGTAGIVVLAAVLGSHGGWVWATWTLGCAMNYAALAVHAVALYPRGRLETALEGVDVRAELRRYKPAQLLLFIPALIALTRISAQQVDRNLRDHLAHCAVSVSPY